MGVPALPTFWTKQTTSGFLLISQPTDFEVMAQLLTAMVSKTEPKDFPAIKDFWNEDECRRRVPKEIAARASEALARIVAAEVRRKKLLRRFVR